MTNIIITIEKYELIYSLIVRKTPKHLQKKRLHYLIIPNGQLSKLTNDR